MADAVFQLYDAVLDVVDGDIDFASDTIMVALMSAGFAHDNAHTVWGDVSAHEISGAGYTAGGLALTGATWARSGSVRTLDANDAVWSALTATGVLGAVVYRADASDPAKRYLVASGQLDAAAFNVDGKYEILWPATGILRQRKG